MAQDSNLPATLAATSGFRPGTFPLGQPSGAESGGHGPHALQRALVSTEARSLTGSLSMRTLPGIRTRTHAV
jgi:hypothetical protein